MYQTWFRFDNELVLQNVGKRDKLCETLEFIGIGL